MKVVLEIVAAFIVVLKVASMVVAKDTPNSVWNGARLIKNGEAAWS